MAQWCIPCSIQLSGPNHCKKYGCGERICGKRDQDKPLRRCEVGRSVSRRLAASNNVGYPYLPVQRLGEFPRFQGASSKSFAL